MGYYENDRMLGDSCTINNKNAYSEFKADLIDFITNGGDIEALFQKNTGNSSLRLVNYNYGIPNFVARFYVVGADKSDSIINANRLVAECKKCIFKTSATNFEYDCILISYNIEETGIDEYNYVALNFSAIRRLPLVTLTKSIASGSSYSIENRGTLESGIRIKIRSTNAIPSIKIGDITIKDIAANSDFIIDGIEGAVLYNGANAILKTDLIDFPKIKAGSNTIYYQIYAGTTMTIEYYPTFNF